MASFVSQHLMDEMVKEFKANPYAFISSFNGVTVADMGELRRNLSTVAKRSLVVKHSVARKVFESLQLGDAAKFFKDNVLVTLGDKEPQEISKKLTEFSKVNNKFLPRAVVFEKKVYDEAYIQTLSKLPTRKELLTQVVVRIKSPISGFVLTLNQLLRGVAVAINEIKKKKEAAALA